MSSSTPFSLKDITGWIARSNTCNDKGHVVHVLTLDQKHYLINEACAEGQGTATLVLLDISGSSPNKTELANGSNYNRGNFLAIRTWLQKYGFIHGNGYGEAFGNAECGNNGDLWLCNESSGKWNTHHLCSPYGNTAGGNLYDVLYDKRMGLFISGGTGAGWYLQRWDPSTWKYKDSWEVADPSNGLWMCHLLYDVDNDYYILVTGGKNTQAPTVKFYKVPSSVLINNWKSTQYLVNANGVELLLDTQKNGYTRDTFIFGKNIIEALDDNGTHTWYLVDTDKWTLTKLDYAHGLSLISSGEYLLHLNSDTNNIEIYDKNQNKIQDISFDFSSYTLVWGIYSDDWITAIVDKSNNNYKLTGLAYNGHIPYINYDPTTGKFRVEDLLTGDPVTATIKYVDSPVACGQIGCIARNWKTLKVSDWTLVPMATKGIINMYIVEIEA